VKLFFEAFLPPVLHNGVAFECHPQNCVARFDLKTKELKGFIIRDFGGLRVHRESLRASTGVELDFLEGHSVRFRIIFCSVLLTYLTTAPRTDHSRGYR
jgi:siderophore synthetase component